MLARMGKQPHERVQRTRRPSRAPFDEARENGERAPDGRPLCRWCGGGVPAPRRSWCSQPCVDEWLERADPQHQRYKVALRDKGVCAACGLDTQELARVLRRDARLPEEDDRGRRRRERFLRGRMRLARDRRMGVPVTDHLWEMDHVHPVAEGGGGCGLENLQTLCVWCHREKTAEQAKRAKAERDRAKDEQARAAGQNGSLFG